MVKLVRKEYVGKPSVTRFIMGFFGRKQKGPFQYYFDDGYIFRPYPRGINSEADLARRGCKDPTGKKYQRYVDAAGLGKGLPPGHYVNWLELDRG